MNFEHIRKKEFNIQNSLQCRDFKKKFELKDYFKRSYIAESVIPG